MVGNDAFQRDVVQMGAVLGESLLIAVRLAIAESASVSSSDSSTVAPNLIWLPENWLRSRRWSSVFPVVVTRTLPRCPACWSRTSHDGRIPDHQDVS